MELDIKAAATLYKMARSTIYNKMEKGELSRLPNGKLDYVELLRVFGEPTNRKTRQEAKAQAIAENERIKAQAQDDIEQEINRARDALRSQVAVLAIAGAEKILRTQVDANAHAAMLNQLATEL